MCQILFCTEDNPPIEVLEAANRNNPHGFGYGWAENEQVHWVKGFTEQQFDDGVLDFLSKPFPKAIHFRLATHGGISNELTHPFPIKRGNPLTLEGSAKAVLFHNGVWNAWDDRLREAIFGGTLSSAILREPMSDSRAMAILAQRFGPDILDVCGLGSNKVLVLMPETYYKYGSWYEKKGWSHSNSKVDDKKDERKGYVVVSNPSAAQQTSMNYLTAERGEVEAHLRLWGDHGRT